MVTVNFINSRFKADSVCGKLTRASQNGIYILSCGKEYYIAKSCVVSIDDLFNLNMKG